MSFRHTDYTWAPTNVHNFRHRRCQGRAWWAIAPPRIVLALPLAYHKTKRSVESNSAYTSGSCDDSCHSHDVRHSCERALSACSSQNPADCTNLKISTWWVLILFLLFLKTFLTLLLHFACFMIFLAACFLISILNWSGLCFDSWLLCGRLLTIPSLFLGLFVCVCVCV